MGLNYIPIAEIEGALLAHGALIRQYLRDPQKPREDGSLSLLLVDGLPRVRTVTQGLGQWVGRYLSPEQVAMIAAMPDHERWRTLHEEILTDEQLLDLAERLQVHLGQNQQEAA
jgi:hypothetical protein